jgi:glycosyltransferase involved in cell wall biosynthesis
MNVQRIKLIQIIADSDLSGGPTHVLGILKNIDKKKYDVSLICPSGELSQKAKEIREVGVYNVSMQSKFDIVALLEIKTAIAKIRLKFDPFGPAIVHAHGTRAGLLARLFLTRKIKTVYTEHRWDADYHIKNKLNEKIQLWMSRKLNYKTDVIVAVSSSVKRFLLDKKLAPRDRIAVIPNGINLEKSKIKYQISK